MNSTVGYFCKTNQVHGRSASIALLFSRWLSQRCLSRLHDTSRRFPAKSCNGYKEVSKSTPRPMNVNVLAIYLFCATVKIKRVAHNSIRQHERITIVKLGHQTQSTAYTSEVLANLCRYRHRGHSSVSKCYVSFMFSSRRFFIASSVGFVCN